MYGERYQLMEFPSPQIPRPPCPFFFPLAKPFLLPHHRLSYSSWTWSKKEATSSMDKRYSIPSSKIRPAFPKIIETPTLLQTRIKLSLHRIEFRPMILSSLLDQVVILFIEIPMIKCMSNLTIILDCCFFQYHILMIYSWQLHPSFMKTFLHDFLRLPCSTCEEFKRKHQGTGPSGKRNSFFYYWPEYNHNGITSSRSRKNCGQFKSEMFWHFHFFWFFELWFYKLNYE